jgi:SAM-dependent methyltransferase
MFAVPYCLMPYDEYATHFDAAAGDRTQDIAYLRHLIATHKPDARTLLELGCGTGEILKAFAGTYAVTGIDNSEAMLGIAREKVPNATFLQGDMTEMHGDGQYDVILCVFDTINHLLDRSQWKKLFVSARENLAADGVFIFDINTLHKLEKFAAGDMVGHEANGFIYMNKVTKGENNVFDWTVKIFEKEPENEFLLHEVHIPETSFPLDDVKEMVESVFLSYVETEDPFLGSVTDMSNRVVFICK